MDRRRTGWFVAALAITILLQLQTASCEYFLKEFDEPKRKHNYEETFMLGVKKIKRLWAFL